MKEKGMYDKVKRVLTDKLLIDLSEAYLKEILLDEEKKNICDIVEILLWLSVYQCENYIEKAGRFGPEPLKDVSNTRINIVAGVNESFDYIIRRILTNNVAMNTFLKYGCHIRWNDFIKDGGNYITYLSDTGYFQMSELIDDKGMLSKEFKKEHGNSDPNKLSLLDELRKKRYIVRWSEYDQYLKHGIGNFKIEGDENWHLPLFNCNLFAYGAEHKPLLNQLEKFAENPDKKWSLKQIENFCEMLDTNELCYSSMEASDNDLCKEADRNILLYQIEKYLHGVLQWEIEGVYNQLKDQYTSETKEINRALVEAVNLNCSIGLKYILEYPMAYIANPAIQCYKKEGEGSGVYVGESIALSKWRGLYQEYLAMLAYTSMPVLQATFETNLYDYSKLELQDKSRPCKQRDIQRRMFQLLEQYILHFSRSIFCDFTPREDSNIAKRAKDYNEIHEKAFMKSPLSYAKEVSELRKCEDFPTVGKMQLFGREKEVQGKTKKIDRSIIWDAYSFWYNPKNFALFFDKKISEEYISVDGWVLSKQREKIEESRSCIQNQHGVPGMAGFCMRWKEELAEAYQEAIYIKNVQALENDDKYNKQDKKQDNGKQDDDKQDDDKQDDDKQDDSKQDDDKHDADKNNKEQS